MELRTITTVTKNGINGAAFRIPQKFNEVLKWKPGETQVYVTLTDDGKVVVEPVSAELKKAAS
ncbi:MAG TPA: hypothetical protein VJ873_12060 [bacterium]|nr:hypothetical protein [bacterium]